MMSKAVRNILVRAVKSRLAAGEEFEEIMKSYPKLAKAKIEEIKKAL